jgi:hypothetical protein
MKEFKLDSDTIIIIESNGEWLVKTADNDKPMATSEEEVERSWPGIRERIGLIKLPQTLVDLPRVRSGNNEVDIHLKDVVLRIGFFYYAEHGLEKRIGSVAQTLFHSAVQKAADKGDANYLKLDEDVELKDLTKQEIEELTWDILIVHSQPENSDLQHVRLSITGAAVLSKGPAYDVPDVQETAQIEVAIHPTANLTGGTVVDKSQVYYQWSYASKLIGVIGRSISPRAHVAPLARGVVIFLEPTVHHVKSEARTRWPINQRKESIGFLVNGGTEILVVTLINDPVLKTSQRPNISAMTTARRAIEMLQRLDNLYPNGYLKDNDRGFVGEE